MEDFKNRLLAFIESLSGMSYREFEEMRNCPGDHHGHQGEGPVG